MAVLEETSSPSRMWVMIVEFQSVHDPNKLDITLLEVARLRNELRHNQDSSEKYFVLSALVYLRDRCTQSVLDMTGGTLFGTRYAPLIWNVGDESAEETLQRVEQDGTCWGLLFWIPLMIGANEAKNVDRWKQAVQTLAPAHMRSDLLGIALVFAELAGYYPIWKRFREEWDMITESQVVNGWIAQAQEETGLQSWREAILRVLRKRFPNSSILEVDSTIQSQPNLNLLKEWHDAAIDASTLTEFVAVLRR